jgi:hypothetical protein
MAVLVRIMMAFVAYILACIAASIVLTIATLTPEWDDLASAGLSTFVVWTTVGIGALIVASVAFMPALLLIALAEGFAWRSSILYAALGGVLALSLSYGLDFAGYAGEAGSPLVREREVFAAAGIAGGFVYWLFAGRKAGAWK